METTLRFDVEGMTCGGCVRRVRQALESIPGVTVERVAVGQPVAVRLEQGAVDRAALTAAIERAGYRATIPDGD